MSALYEYDSIYHILCAKKVGFGVEYVRILWGYPGCPTHDASEIIICSFSRLCPSQIRLRVSRPRGWLSFRGHPSITDFLLVSSVYLFLLGFQYPSLLSLWSLIMSFSYLSSETLDFLQHVVDSGSLVTSADPSSWKGCAFLHLEFISPSSQSPMDFDCFLRDQGLPHNLLSSQRDCARVSKIRLHVPDQPSFKLFEGCLFGCRAKLNFEGDTPIAHAQQTCDLWPLGVFHEATPPTFVHHFAGAFGGWSQVQRWLVAHGLIHEPNQTIMIECDYQTCVQAQRTLGATMAFPDDINLPASKKVIVQGDVADMRWARQIITGENMMHTASFPCQPFSRGGKKSGIECRDGQTIIRLAVVLRFMQPVAIALENVADFRCHSHASVIFRFLKWAGFGFAWQQTHDLQSLSSCNRARWLGVFIRQDLQSKVCMGTFHLHESNKTMWDAVSYRFDLPPKMIQQLILTPEMLECYGDKTLLPKSKQIKGQMTSQQVLQARCPQSEDNLGTLVASYMRQHELPFHHLAKHGIFAELMINGADQVSFIDPVRWAAMMGNMHTLFLPENLEDAFQMLGNCIATPHAALALIVMLNHTICQKVCIPVEQSINQMWADRTLVNQAMVVENESGFAILTPNDFLMIGPICRYNQITESCNPHLIAFTWPDGSHTDVEIAPDQSVREILVQFGVPDHLLKLWGFRARCDGRIFQGEEVIDRQCKTYKWVFLPNAPECEIQCTLIDTVSATHQPISPTLPWTGGGNQQSKAEPQERNEELHSFQHEGLGGRTCQSDRCYRNPSTSTENAVDDDFHQQTSSSLPEKMQGHQKDEYKWIVKPCTYPQEKQQGLNCLSLLPVILRLQAFSKLPTKKGL